MVEAGRAMRVLMLTSSYPCREGDWRGGFVRDLGRALVREGLDVTVAAPRPPDPFQPPPVREGDPGTTWLPAWLPVRARGFHGVGLEANLRRDPRAGANLMPFLAAYTLEACVQAAFADVIVAHWLLPMGLVGAVLSRWSSRPLGVVAHSGPPWPARLPPLSRLVQSVVARAASVACVSESVRAEVEARGGARGGARGRIEVLPLGIDLRPSAEPPPLDNRPLRLLFVGRLVPLKGADLLSRAARDVGRSGSGRATAWTVIGEGPERARLEDGVPPCVRFLGECDSDRTRAEMAVHDALVVPSRSGRFGRAEGLPRVLLEAWACGLPVLAADTGGLGEAIRRHGGGVLFRPDDVEGLVRAVREFEGDPALRSRLRREALDAASLHAWDRLAPRWAEWVRGLAR